MTLTTAARTLHIWLPGDPPNLDPQTGVDEWSHRLHIAWYEGLIRPARSGQLGPGLAVQWHISPDGTAVTLRLRQDATWSDGRTVQADDVVYAVERALDPRFQLRAAWQMYVLRGGRERHQGHPAPAVGIRTLARDTVRIDLAEPVPYLADLWALPPFAPLRRDAPPSSQPALLAELPVTGPFRPVEYKPGGFIRLIRNERYWDRAAMPAGGLTVQIGGDPVARFDAGEVDLAPVGEREASGMDPSLVTRVAECTVLYLLLNADNAVTRDPRVRAAVASAVDGPEVARLAAPACPPLDRLVPPSPGNSSYRAMSPTVGVPRASATGILSGLSLDLLCGDLPQARGEAQVVAEQLSRAGADVRLVAADYAQRFWAIRRSQYQMALVAWKADFDDPLAFLREHVSDGAAGNQSKWSDQCYNKLLAVARITVDDRSRYRLLAEAEQRLLSSRHVIPLLQRSRTWLARPGLCNVVHRAAGASPDLRWARLP